MSNYFCSFRIVDTTDEKIIIDNEIDQNSWTMFRSMLHYKKNNFHLFCKIEKTIKIRIKLYFIQVKVSEFN